VTGPAPAPDAEPAVFAAEAGVRYPPYRRSGGVSAGGCRRGLGVWGVRGRHGRPGPSRPRWASGVGRRAVGSAPLRLPRADGALEWPAWRPLASTS